MKNTFALAFILLISAISVIGCKRSTKISKGFGQTESNPRKLDDSTTYNSYIEVVFGENIAYPLNGDHFFTLVNSRGGTYIVNGDQTITENGEFTIEAGTKVEIHFQEPCQTLQ